MEYSQKLIRKYFISAVGEFQKVFLEVDLGFHEFEPFRKLTRHCAAAPGAKVFLYMPYIQFSTCGIVSTQLDHLEISHSTAQPLPNASGANDPGTIVPVLDAPFVNVPSWS